MTEVDSRTGLLVLDRVECLRLLRRHHLGRLAIIVGGRPVVLPVNFAIDQDCVVFRTDPGTKLTAAVGGEVAFEIDGADALYHEGWSVLVTGTGVEVDDAAEIARLARLPIGTWCPSPQAHWVRIVPDSITGRRIPPNHERPGP